MRNYYYYFLALLFFTLFSNNAFSQKKEKQQESRMLFTEYKTVQDYAVIYFNIKNLSEDKWKDVENALKENKNIFFARIYTSIDNQTHCQIKSKNIHIFPEEIQKILQKYNADFAFTSVRRK